MPRGYLWAVYISDNPVRRFAKLVDADQVADPDRGWSFTGVEDLTPFPQQSKARRVYGVSPTTGRRGSTVIGSTSAALWTGAASTFTGETNSGGFDTYTVTFRAGEVIRHFPVGP